MYHNQKVSISLLHVTTHFLADSTHVQPIIQEYKHLSSNSATFWHKFSVGNNGAGSRMSYRAIHNVLKSECKLAIKSNNCVVYLKYM